MSDAARENTPESVIDRIERALGGSEEPTGKQQLPPDDGALDDEQPTGELDEEKEQDADEGDEPRGEESGDDDDAEGDAEEQPEGDADDDGDEADEGSENLDESPIESLDQLAEALQTSPEELRKQLKVTLPVDGEEMEVTLDEAFKGYQREADYTRKTMRVAEKEKALTEREQRQTRQLELAREISKEQHGVVMKALMAELNSPAMRQLQQQDPARFILKRDEIQQRAQEVQRAAQRAVQAYQQREQEEQESLREELAAYRQEQLEALKKAVPGWNNTRRDAVRDFMVSELGYTDEEVGQVFDHRIIAAAARLMDASKASTGKQGKAGKTGKPKPNTEKPPQGLLRPSRSDQPRRPGLAAKQKELRAARNRLKKSGKVADAAALIEKTL